MRVNKYYPFAVVYFFLNSLGLPYGLLYSMILTPLFYVWIVLKGKRDVLAKFALLALPFVVNHFINGVDAFQYFRSLALFFTVYIFCYAFYTLLTTQENTEDIFYKLLVANFVLTLIAVFSFLTPYHSLFWSEWNIETGELKVSELPRLIMFTYEPSYYSTLLAPIFSFYLTRLILSRRSENTKWKVAMALIPLALSFSMGVIASLIIATTLLFFFNFLSLLKSRRILLTVSLIFVVVASTILVLIIFFPHNAFYVRVVAILSGSDASANGRTYQAFELAHKIAEQKSMWWGVGPGQLKIIGDPIIKAYYRYPPSYGQVSIPAAFQESIALFGYIGASIRILVEIYLFFKTRVLNNYYRTLLFFYVFVYQFTGSFTTNIAEYVIWILAFTNVFPEFDRQKKSHEIKL